MENELKIQTPEGVIFSLQLAGPIVRMVAWTIDTAVITALCALFANLAMIVKVFSPDLHKGLTVVAGFAISVLYAVFTEWFWRGQTVGKRLLRLRVVEEQGLRLQFSQIVTRNLLRFVDMLPGLYLLGGVTCMVNRRRQRLGDIAAGTIVIREEKVLEPDLDQLGTAKYNSLREHPHLAARLRQRISPEIARVALQALLRREEYDPEARVELFSQLARYFKGLVPYPPETVEAIADEQYVRNVVEILFRPIGVDAVRAS